MYSICFFSPRKKYTTWNALRTEMHARVPPPFEGRKPLLPTRYELARIEGTRIAQLQLCAPSTVPDVVVGPNCSPADAYAVELDRGCVPLALIRPPPPGSRPSTKSRVVTLGPGGRDVVGVE